MATTRMCGGLSDQVHDANPEVQSLVDQVKYLLKAHLLALVLPRLS